MNAICELATLLANGAEAEALEALSAIISLPDADFDAAMRGYHECDAEQKALQVEAAQKIGDDLASWEPFE